MPTGEPSQDRPRADASGGGRAHTALAGPGHVVRQALPHHPAGLQQDVHHAPREAAAAAGRRDQGQAPLHRRDHRRHRDTALRHARQRRHCCPKHTPWREIPGQTEGSWPRDTDRLQRGQHTQKRRPQEYNNRPHPTENGDSDVSNDPRAVRHLPIAASDVDADQDTATGASCLDHQRDGSHPERAHHVVESHDHAEDPQVADGDPPDGDPPSGDAPGGDPPDGGGERGGGPAPITKPDPAGRVATAARDRTRAPRSV